MAESAPAGNIEVVKLKDWEREALKLRNEGVPNVPATIAKKYDVRLNMVEMFLERKQRRLAVLDEEAIERLAIKYGITQECVIHFWASTWNRLKAEFGGRDLSDVKTEKLFEMMISGYEKMMRAAKMDFDTMPEPHKNAKQDYAKILCFINDPNSVTFGDGAVN